MLTHRTGLALLLALTLTGCPWDDAPTTTPTPPPTPPAPPPVVEVGTVKIDFGVVERAPLEKEVPFKQGMTALDALRAAAEVKLTDADPTHPRAVDSIDGVRTDLSTGRFWMLDVNGQHAQRMPQDIVLRPDFVVAMSYVTPPVTVTLDYGPVGRPKKTVQVDYTDRMTALDALFEAAFVEMTDADPTHPFAVGAVDGIETDLGKSWFWMYDVNDEHPQVMADDYRLKAGYEVTWTYGPPPITVKIDYGPLEREDASVQVTFTERMTALDALFEAADVEMTDADPNHPFAVAAINGVETNLEQGRFWLYDVNGQHPDVMADAYTLKPGFEVVWTFTTPEDRPADEVPATETAPTSAASAAPTPANSQGMANRLGALGEETP